MSKWQIVTNILYLQEATPARTSLSASVLLDWDIEELLRYQDELAAIFHCSLTSQN